MVKNTAPRISTAMSMKGKTAEMMATVNKTIRENSMKESMKSGSTVSTSSWSLENRLTIRPDGVMSKKLVGMEIICGGSHLCLEALV